MPSLFRFLLVVGSVAAICYASLYVLAYRFEPEQHEVSLPVPGVKIKKQ